MDEADDERRGAPLAVYRHIKKHLKLGIGYNFTDFSDELPALDYENTGWFVKLVGKM